MAQNMVSPPPGGSSSQCLMKDTNSNGDVSWGTLIKKIEIIPYSDLLPGKEQNIRISNLNLTDSSRIVGYYVMTMNMPTFYNWWDVRCMIDQFSSSILYFKIINNSDTTIPKEKFRLVITYI